MLSRFLPTVPCRLLRSLVVLATCVSLAHAADGPGLVDSLGKLLNPAAPAPTASAPAAGHWSATVTPSGQGRRIALVIGNGNYHQHGDKPPKYKLPVLLNPANDAEDIASALRGFGFEVIERKNQTIEAMNESIAEFGSKIGGSEAALFYFAGHGIQVNNQNYLMPISARLESDSAVPYQGINVNQVLDEMERGKSSANIVMLDACRNNPISGKYRSGDKRGLASPGNTPQGTVIVYATDPGNEAADGDGRNGLFSAGLLTAFKGKDLSLDGVLTVASEYVEQKSLESDPKRKQTPYVNGPKTLQKTFQFRITVDPGRGEIEKTIWTSIEHSNDPADFAAYLRKYPNGSYKALAENRLKQLQAAVTKPAAAPEASKPAVPPAPTLRPPVAIIADDPEGSLWAEVKSSGAKEYYEAYLKQYPKGKYVALAKLELKKIDDREKAEKAKEEAERKAVLAREDAERKLAAERDKQAQAKADQDSWEAAKAENTPNAYSGYLERFPRGRYAALAEPAKQKAEHEQAERKQQEANNMARAVIERLESAPKPYSVAPLTRTPSGIPVLYASAIAELREKLTASQLAWLMASYRRDADAGNAVAQFSLGQLYTFGLGTDENHAEMVRWYRKAAEQGFALGQANLGSMYSDGRGVTKDEAEAVRWYRKAAEQGIATSQYNLGLMYATGRGVAKDEAEAVRWYRKAAEQGYAIGQVNLGAMYSDGRGVAKDEAEAVRWFRKAAEQGDASGQNRLGAMYTIGSGVAKDEAEAVRWYRKAAEQGYASGQVNLGLMYATGTGVAKDEAEAVRWYRKAAEQGYASGQVGLGAIYSNGRGVAKDEAEAVRWFRKAAEQGDASGQNRLGAMYAIGSGVAKDEAEAVRWYRKAAEQGDAHAIKNLKSRGLSP